MYLLENYLTVIIFLFISIALSLLLVGLSSFFWWLTTKHYKKTQVFLDEKVSAYECGFEPFTTSRVIFDVHFYIVAILFLIFDLEVVYLLPWSAELMQMSLNSNAILIMLAFLIILVLGFVYEWFLGALDWSHEHKIFVKEQEIA